jgi:23S rRNA (cytidine1920-2'-O)/16S rRNA (cytidine1409-2'-O)-methyltransferase
MKQEARYVSRAGLKLAHTATIFKLNFKDKIILDVGSSTGGFTDYALQNGAKKVVAVDSGTQQLYSSLREDGRIDLREKTDIREVKELKQTPDIILIDVSFISLKEILPHLFKYLSNENTNILAMVKPQFEAKPRQLNQGIIKNNTIRRDILKNFENWLKPYAIILNKFDNVLSGAKGNQERFYLLKSLKK